MSAQTPTSGACEGPAPDGWLRRLSRLLLRPHPRGPAPARRIRSDRPTRRVLLALLAMDPVTGQELIRLTGDHRASVWAVIHRLELVGWISVAFEPGTYGGAGQRTVYRLTMRGREEALVALARLLPRTHVAGGHERGAKR